MYENKSLKRQNRPSNLSKHNIIKQSTNTSRPKNLYENTPQKSKASINSSVKRNDDNTKSNYPKYHMNNSKSPVSHDDNYQNIDLNIKIAELTTEINNLKEKLADVNLSNVHLKNMLRDKDPQHRLKSDLSSKNQVIVSYESTSYNNNENQNVNSSNNVNTFSFNMKPVVNNCTPNGKYEEIKNWSTSNSVTITPSTAGTYDLWVAVKDSKGTIIKKNIKFTFDKALGINSFTTDKLSPQYVGTSVKLTVQAVGGKGTKQYKYYRYLNGKYALIKDWSLNNTVAIAPKNAGVYDIWVGVKDSTGKIVRKNLKFTFN